MVDISGSVAKKTVTFDQPMRGSDIIEAVRATAGDKFFEQKKYDDGMLHLVGQSSSTPYQNLVVTPNKTDAYISPDQMYESAVVVRQDVQGGTRTMARYDVDHEIDAVLKFSEGFAESARRIQNGGPERSRDPYAAAAGAVRTNPTRAAHERTIPPTAPPQAATDRGW